MIALMASVWVASVVGSLHCAGMCGAFACFCSAGAEGRAGAWKAQAAYHGGRLLSYATLGALAGAIGQRLDALGAASGIHHVAAILAGTLMVVWGGLTATHALGRTAARFATPVPLARALRAVRDLPHVPRALAIGMLTTLLPCGWLYAFVAGAAGSGSALRGTLFMLAFWAGTVPALLFVGVAARRALDPLRRRVPALIGALLVVLGLLTITGRTGVHAESSASGTSPHHACH